MENKVICPGCYGDGYWEAECCNGAGGCSCHGRAVNMGTCNVCNGEGFVAEDRQNSMANVEFLKRSGACFLGSGPQDGSWAGAISLGYSND